MGQVGKQKRKAEGPVVVAATKPKVKLSLRDKTSKDVRNMAKRIARLGMKLVKLPRELCFDTGGAATVAVDEAIASIVVMFGSLATAVEALPDDWRPAGGKRGRPGLVVGVGDNVQIREKNAPKYADLFPAGTNLVVTDVKTALVGVKPPSGTTVVYVPKGHLMCVEAPAVGGLASALGED